MTRWARQPATAAAGSDRLGNAMWRRRRTGLLAAAGIALIGAAGCGSDDFANDPRPPAPIELTAKVDDRKVSVSPVEIDGEPIGAGLATVTIANLTDDEVQLTLA